MISRVNSPPLVVFALSVRLEVVVALKPFGAFCAVESAQTRQILWIFRVLVLLEVTGGFDIRDDLIVVSVIRLAISASASDRYR